MHPPSAALLLALLASDDCSVLAALAVILAGAILYGFFFIILRNRRMAENLPTSTCRAVPMGLVEIAGRATGSVPIRSPFAGVPCFCARVQVQHWTRGDNSESWAEAYGETFSTPFYVDDGTGRIRVEPAEAELRLSEDLYFDNTSGLRDAPGLRQRLAAAGADPAQFAQRLRDFCSAGSTSAREELLAKETRYSVHQAPAARGDISHRIFALGLHGAQLLRDMRRDLFARKPRKHGSDDRPMRVREETLCPGDTVYVLGTACEVPGATDEFDRIVIRRSGVHPWFVIGKGPQKEVLARMTRGLWLVGATGIGLMLLGIAMLLDCAGLW